MSYNQQTKKLQNNGYYSMFLWVLSHFGILGNKKDDLVAKNRVEKDERLTEH